MKTGHLPKKDYPPVLKMLVEGAIQGDNDAIKEALRQGADIHADRDEALHLAARNGQTHSVRLLLERGADIHAANDVALRWAAECGHADTVEFLINKGAHIHANDDVALREAAREGHYVIVEFLLNNNANLHAENEDAVCWAAFKGNKEIVALLLDWGADINARNGEVLSGAAGNGTTETVELLIERGADVHADGEKALKAALENDRRYSGLALLRHGADAQACMEADNAPAIKEWLMDMKFSARRHFTHARPKETQCFEEGKLHEAVLDACATGQFTSRVAAPLMESAQKTDRKLFQEVWDALPRHWQHSHQNTYMQFMKEGGLQPRLGIHTQSLSGDAATHTSNTGR